MSVYINESVDDDFLDFACLVTGTDDRNMGGWRDDDTDSREFFKYIPDHFPPEYIPRWVRQRSTAPAGRRDVRKRSRHPDQRSESPDSGFEALRSTAEFCGPIEPLEGHEDVGHFALVYEEQAEQFAAVVPFIREGLDRGERIVYVLDESSRENVLAALRNDGVAVDAALEKGQLSFHTAEEIYFNDGEFAPDATREVLEDAIAAAREEYEGFRVTAEESWLADVERAQSAFVPYEAHANHLCDAGPEMALCQYNRAELPPDVIEDVINTHPYLIHDNTVCQNGFYTPPEEYFGSDRLACDNTRKLDALVERTTARASLETREQYQREFYEITADPNRSFREKLDALFALGCDWFDLALGGLAKIDPDNDLLEVEVVNGDHDHLVPRARFDLTETYSRVATDNDAENSVAEPVAVTDPVDAGFKGDQSYEQLGIQTYFGTHLHVDGDDDRTFWFVSNEPHEEGFSEGEHTFLHLMGQWVRNELERQHRERTLRRTKNQFEAVFENSNDAIFITDPYEDEIVDANPAGLEMLGYERDELLTLGPSDCHPHEMEQFKAFVDRVFRDGQG